MKRPYLTFVGFTVSCMGPATGESDPVQYDVDVTDGFSDQEVEQVLRLVELGTEDSITSAFELAAGMTPAEQQRLVELTDSEYHAPAGSEEDGIGPSRARSYAGSSIPAEWDIWPSGRFPYSATSARGVCGPDTDLIARYRSVSFSAFSDLRLVTNNAVTYAVVAAHGWDLTAYEADDVSDRVSVCAGLGPLAGIPIVRNQLASLVLEW